VSTYELSWTKENQETLQNCRAKESANEVRITFTIYNETNANTVIPCIPGKHSTVGYWELSRSAYTANIHQSLMKMPIPLLNKNCVGLTLDTKYKKVTKRHCSGNLEAKILVLGVTICILARKCELLWYRGY
jgi:hypothetical protein